MKWPLIFSWWGFALSLLRALNFSPVSPLLILIVNMIGTCFFLILKENIAPSVTLFILATHAVPVYLFRRDSLDPVGSLLIFLSYLLYLHVNNTTMPRVYSEILEDPIPSIGFYLGSRVI